MNVLTRRQSFASLLGGVFALAGSKSTAAQSQVAGNGASIVATGDVHLGQQASASQTVRGAGSSVTGTGIQVVTNDGRIVATGDVWVDQEAAASQEIHHDVLSGSCTPGQFWTERGVVFFCDSSCTLRQVDCGCKGKCR